MTRARLGRPRGLWSRSHTGTATQFAVLTNWATESTALQTEPAPVSAPLLFQPSPDAVYGFPHARLVACVDSPYQRIEMWGTDQLGRLSARPIFHARRIAALLDGLRAAFGVVHTMNTCVPLYGSLWMMASASDTLDPAALTVDMLAARLAARRIDSLKHYEPAMHAGLLSASRSVRDKLSQFLKSSS